MGSHVKLVGSVMPVEVLSVAGRFAQLWLELQWHMVLRYTVGGHL